MLVVASRAITVIASKVLIAGHLSRMYLTNLSLDCVQGLNATVLNCRKLYLVITDQPIRLGCFSDDAHCALCLLSIKSLRYSPCFNLRFSEYITAMPYGTQSMLQSMLQVVRTSNIDSRLVIMVQLQVGRQIT